MPGQTGDGSVPVSGEADTKCEQTRQSSPHAKHLPPTLTDSGMTRVFSLTSIQSKHNLALILLLLEKGSLGPEAGGGRVTKARYNADTSRHFISSLNCLASAVAH